MAFQRLCDLLHELKPALLMVVVQFGFAGVNVFYKLAANDGMSLRIIVAYRFVFATAFMAPIALIFERKIRPKLTWLILFQAFLCGLFGGSLAQNLYVESLSLTSATFASAMTNLIPAFTFVMAITFGLEKLGLGSAAGKAKVVGTLMGIGGAMLLTFYKGSVVNIWSTHVDLLKHSHPHGGQVASSHGTHAVGSLLAIGSCLSYAFWLIVQAKMSKKYPCPYSSTALMSLMGSIQAIVFALCVRKDWNEWKLGWNIRLLTVAYSGIVGSGLMVTLISWCVRIRGPLFVSVFSPLMLVLVIVAASLVLEEKLHIGSILGGALIVCGLYVVLWGNSKEMKKMNQLAPCKCSPEVETINIVVTSPDQNTSNNNSSNNNDDYNNITDADLLETRKETEEIKDNITEKKRGEVVIPSSLTTAV